MKIIGSLILAANLFVTPVRNMLPADSGQLKRMVRYSGVTKTISQNNSQKKYSDIPKIMIIAGGIIVIGTALIIPWNKERGQ